MKSIKNSIRLLLSTVFVLSCMPLSAHYNGNNTKSIFDQISAIEMPEIVITVDLEAISGEDRRDENYHKATFEVYNKKALQSSWEIKIKQRGKYRRRICDFPPLKLNFDKEQLHEKGLADYDKLKLVTHCVDDKVSGNENIIREYLAYKMYNELTDQSFRVQLVKVVYQDINGKGKKIKRYGILIECTDQLGDRIQMTECENCLNLSKSVLDMENAGMVAVFQYMIGNEDWSWRMNRNLKTLRSEQHDQHIYVPYDFDFSGLVNTSYALPSTDQGLSSVRDRAFMGQSMTATQLKQVTQHFKDKEEAILNVVKDCKELSYEGRTYLITYLRSFYDEIDRLPVPTVAESSEMKVDTSSSKGK